MMIKTIRPRKTLKTRKMPIKRIKLLIQFEHSDFQHCRLQVISGFVL